MRGRPHEEENKMGDKRQEVNAYYYMYYNILQAY